MDAVAIGEAFTDLATGNHPSICKKAIKLPMMMPASSCCLSPLHYQIHLSLPCLPFFQTNSGSRRYLRAHITPVPNKLVRCASFPFCIYSYIALAPCPVAGVALECIPNAYQKVKATSTVVNGSQRLAFLTQFWWRRWASADSDRSQLISSSDSCFGYKLVLDLLSCSSGFVKCHWNEPNASLQHILVGVKSIFQP